MTAVATIETSSPIATDMRVLVLSPTSRDESICAGLLTGERILSVPCRDLADVSRQLTQGAMALIACETVIAGQIDELAAALGDQPRWSDLPVLLLANGGADSPAAQEAARRLSKVLLLSRPVHVATFVSAVRMAVQSRRRQYQVRDQMEALRESEDRFRTLADNMSQFAWMADEEGRIIWYNQRWYDYTGTNLEEMRGWGWQKVHHPDHVQRVVQKIAHCFETGRVWEDTFPLRGKDGRYRWFLSRAIPIRDSQGRTVRWFGTNTDITALREAERARDALLESERAARTAMERANRAKDEFLSMVNHELRSPLATVLGWSRVLGKCTITDPDAQEAVDAVIRGGEQLRTLISDLLDLSRAVTGKLGLSPTATDVVEVVRDAVADFKPQAAEAGVSLLDELPTGAVCVMADQGRIHQVLANLLSNAIKFTPENGRVLVRVLPGERHVAISIEDTGIGIAPEVLPRLFERFQQADNSISRKYKGLGLGLALVKQITEMHGGRVQAQSEGANKGATIVVELPRMDPSVLISKPAAPVATDLNGLRVLLVDDDQDTLNLTARLLAESGAQVARCNSAATALSTLKADAAGFDVLVSDISMPVMDGYSLLREVRALPDPLRANIPAIAVTAFGRAEDKHRSLRAGFAVHHTKPVDPTELCAAVHDLAGRPV